MLFLYILLSVIVFVILLLCINVVLVLDYHDKFVFDIRWLFIKYRVYPTKEKKLIEAAPPKQEDESKKPEKKKEKSTIISDFYHNQGFDGVLELIQNTAASVKGVLQRTVKAVVIRDLDLYVRITGDDAAKTAVNYGALCAALYPAIGTINSAIRIEKHHIDISPDFLSDSNKATFSAVVTVMPIKLTNAAVVFLFQIVFGVLLKLFLGSRKSHNNQRKADKS